MVYTAFDNGVPAVYTSSVTGEDTRPLGITSAILRDISRRGELLVTRHDGPLVWGRGIPGRLERVPITGGAGRVVATDVTAASWGPDGEEIALIRALPAGSRVEWPAGHPVYESRLVLRQVAVSPHGDRIAFVEYTRAIAANHPRDFRGRIVTIDRAGTQRALTDELASVCCIAWSPTADKIYFSNPVQGPKLAIWEVALAGGAHPLLESADDLSVGDVSADERRLLAASSGVRQFLYIERDGEARDLSSSFGHATDLSDDGTQILVEGDPSKDSVEPRIYLRSADGATSRALGEGLFPRLSPDRTRIGVGSVAAPASLRIITLDNSPPRALPDGGLIAREAAMWLPDGHQIVYTGTTAAGAPQLYVQDVDGGQPRRFGPPGATFEGAVSGKLVSPDGRAVAARAAERGWLRVPLDGSTAQPIQGLTADDSVRQWNPDGTQLYVAGPSTAVRPVDRVALATGARTRIASLGERVAAWRGGVEYVFVDRAATRWVYSTLTSHVDLYLIDR